MYRHFFVAASCAAALSHSAHAQVVFVDGSAPGPHDGTSWQRAYLSVQEGIDDASTSAGGGTPWDVLVAEGIYFPTTELYLGATARHATFLLKEGANLRGGYVGWNGGAAGSVDPDDPDGSFFQTILSGASVDNYHVVVADQMGIFQAFPYVVDGFRITEGRADDTSFPHDSGAGMLIRRGAGVALEHVTIRNNDAVLNGGGVWVGETGNDGFLHCKKSRFRFNIARRGAGLYVATNTIDVSLCNVRFRDNGNQAQDISGWPPITRQGGAIWMGPEVLGESANLLIHDNFAYRGGGIFIRPSTVANSVIDFEFRHCTITQNISPVDTTQVPPLMTGAGIEIAEGEPGSGTPGMVGNRLFLDNSIVWGNATGADLHYDGTPADPGIWVFVGSSDIGTTNIIGGSYVPDGATISVDPLFVNPNNNNFRLPRTISNLSPCMDAAAVALVGSDFLDIDENGVLQPVLPLDFDLARRIVDHGGGAFAADMGAFEVGLLIDSTR